MADANTSLPIRTQANGDVVAFLADGTTSTQLLGIDASGRLTIKLDDGSGNAVTSQVNGAQRALDVGINVAGIQIDPRAIRALTSSDVVSVVQSTSPWISKDQADGPVTPGAAASFSSLIGGQFNTSLPTLTTGQQAAIQVDASGRLLIGSIASALPAGANTIGAVTQASGPWTQNLTQVGGASIALGQALMAASLPVTIASNQSVLSTTDAADGSVAAGTAATKSMLGGLVFNTSLPTLTTGQQAALQGDSSGRLFIAPLTNTSVVKSQLQDNAGNGIASTLINSKQRLDVDLASEGAAGAAAPFDTVQVGGSDGTNLRALKTDTAGQLVVDIKDSSGNAFTTSNPLPVVLSSSLPGTAVNKYNTSVSVAALASVNHDYSITASKTFTGKKFWASASGKIRMDVQTSPDGTTFTTFWTGFNSTANPNISVDLDLLSIVDLGTGSKIRIILKNLDLQVFDVFSTISGNEV